MLSRYALSMMPDGRGIESMLKTVIYGIASLACFVISAFATRSSKRKGVVRFWWLSFLLAFGLQLKAIHEGYLTGQTIDVLQAEVSAAQPRTITDEQATRLVVALRGRLSRPVIVISRMMDGEGGDYGDQLTSVLANACQVEERSPSLRMLTDDVVGLGVCSYGTTNKLPGHDALREALIEAAIPCKDVQIRKNSISLKDGQYLLLVVGRKD